MSCGGWRASARHPPPDIHVRLAFAQAGAGIMNRLAGKIAIVTGASQGMGESHSRCMVAEGAQVIMTDVNEQAGKKLAAELGETARFVRHDVRDPAGWREV